MVAQACNPTYLGGSNQENLGSMLVLAKSLQDPHLNQYLGVVVCL
jgi:hypothetical protein